MKKHILLSYLFVLVSYIASSQDNQSKTNVYFSPRITIGYTFGSGMSYGVDFILNIYSIKDYNFGLNYSFYLVNTTTGSHRIKSINLIAENDIISAKIGAGMVKRVWGLKKINKVKTSGVVIDIGAAIEPYTLPSVGVRSFVFKRSEWPFYKQPSYISIYTYYRTPEFYIYQSENSN